jgi:hypothetical protein
MKIFFSQESDVDAISSSGRKGSSSKKKKPKKKSSSSRTPNLSSYSPSTPSPNLQGAISPSRSSSRDIHRLMQDRVKHSIFRFLPLIGLLTSLLIVYFVAQYLLFER